MQADDPLCELLRSLEERLLDPAVRRSGREVADLLADDFVEIGSSGRVFDKRGILENLADEAPVRRSLSEFRVTLLAPGVALTRCRVEAMPASSPAPSVSLRSSVWRLEGDRWRMIFHQGTRV